MSSAFKQILRDESLLMDLHVHTLHCDGSGTPDEIVGAAIAKGLDVIGFSGHSHTPFDTEVCMSVEATDIYEKTVREAAVRYADKIRVFCGTEQDYYSDMPAARWDYVIGAVHYVEVPFADKTPEEAGQSCVYGAFAYPSVDDTTERFEDAIDRFFGGDVYAFAERYYETVSDVVRKTGADIIGHFDLFSKFNAGGENGGKGIYFDESHPRYVAAWRKAADVLLETDAVFELNYGAVNRGRRSEPYPSKPIREYLEEHGGKFVPSSDSHIPETLACWL